MILIVEVNGKTKNILDLKYASEIIITSTKLKVKFSNNIFSYNFSNELNEKEINVLTEIFSLKNTEKIVKLSNILKNIKEKHA